MPAEASGCEASERLLSISIFKATTAVGLAPRAAWNTVLPCSLSWIGLQPSEKPLRIIHEGLLQWSTKLTFGSSTSPVDVHILLLRPSNEWEGRRSAFVDGTKPDKNPFGVGIDASHPSDLCAAFANIVLVNTDCVHPEESVTGKEGLKSEQEVVRDANLPPVADDGRGPF